MTYLLLLSGKNFGGLVYFDGFLVFTYPVCYNFVMAKNGKRSFSRCFFVGKRTFLRSHFIGKRSFSRCFFVGKRTSYQKNVLSLHRK